MDKLSKIMLEQRIDNVIFYAQEVEYLAFKNPQAFNVAKANLLTAKANLIDYVTNSR